MQPFRVLSHSTWLAPLILETVGFTYGIIIIQCQCRARNAAGVQSLLFHVSLGLLQLFSQLNLSVRVSVCVAQKGNKDMDSIPPPPPFAKEIKKREGAAKGQLDFDSGTESGWDVEIGPVPLS